MQVEHEVITRTTKRLISGKRYATITRINKFLTAGTIDANVCHWPLHTSLTVLHLKCTSEVYHCRHPGTSVRSLYYFCDCSRCFNHMYATPPFRFRYFLCENKLASLEATLFSKICSVSHWGVECRVTSIAKKESIIKLWTEYSFQV